MQTHIYRTNLNCDKCRAKVRPLLDSDPKITSWSLNIQDPNKPLTVQSEGLSFNHIQNLIHQAGFEVFEEISPNPIPKQTTPPKQNKLKVYFPLLLILAYLLLGVGLAVARSNRLDAHFAMNVFMGGFFVVFSFFKLLNLKGFHDAYQTYDIISRRWPFYGYIYPFLELTLGVLYLCEAFPLMTNLTTLLLMSVSTVGVVQTLRAKRQIQCACLGTVFDLPMSTVTVVENVTMAVMAATAVGMLLL